MDPILDMLWPTTRAAFDLPEKPLMGQPCNRCGLCCLVETCPLGLMFFGRAKSVCPALKLDGGQSHCQLIAQPEAVLPALIAGDVKELAIVMLGSGTGCDSEMTDADTAVVKAGDPVAMPTAEDQARARQLLDGIMAKIEAA